MLQTTDFKIIQDSDFPNLHHLECIKDNKQYIIGKDFGGWYYQIFSDSDLICLKSLTRVNGNFEAVVEINKWIKANKKTPPKTEVVS
jgi:hypothetical protein